MFNQALSLRKIKLIPKEGADCMSNKAQACVEYLVIFTLIASITFLGIYLLQHPNLFRTTHNSVSDLFDQAADILID